MPQLLVFAPCEKVIISQDENNPTLIALLTQIGGEIGGGPMPPNELTAVPLSWSIFTLWHYEAGDENRKYEQVLILRSPSGEAKMTSPRPIPFKPESNHRVVIRMPHFPIQNGEWKIELYLHNLEEAMPEKPTAVYPLIAHFAMAEKEAAV